MKKRRTWLILIMALLVVAGGSYAAYANFGAPAAEATQEPEVKTAPVRRGNLVVTASGTGSLIPATEVDLGFLTGGVLVEVMAEPSDQVKAGDVLAQLDDIEARKAVADAELQVAQAEATLTEQQDLTAAEQAVAVAEIQVAQAEATLTDQQDTTAAEQAVALAEIQVAQAEATLVDQQDTTAAEQAVSLAEIQVDQAEASLASAQLNLDELLEWTPDGSTVELATANLDAAQADYDKAAAGAENTDDQLTSARVNLEQVTNQLIYAQAAYDTAWNPDRDWELNDARRAPALEGEREGTARSLEKAQLDLEVAQAAYNLAVAGIDDTGLQNAWAKVVSAQVSLEQAETGPSESDIETTRIQVQQAELSLAQAQLNLEAAQLDLENKDATQAELSLAQAQLSLEAAQQDLDNKDTIQAEALAGSGPAQPGSRAAGL